MMLDYLSAYCLNISFNTFYFAQFQIMKPKFQQLITYLIFQLFAISPPFPMNNDSLFGAVKAIIINSKEEPISLDHLSNWNTSNSTNMSRLFDNSRRNFDSFTHDLSKWNVSLVTNMTYMFFGSFSFNSNLSNWDVSRTTEMRHMFQFAKYFNSDLSNWSTGEVIDMAFMFNCAESFNQDLNQWNISNVKIIKRMLYDARKFNQTLLWDISRIEYNSDFSRNYQSV